MGVAFSNEVPLDDRLLRFAESRVAKLHGASDLVKGPQHTYLLKPTPFAASLWLAGYEQPKNSRSREDEKQFAAFLDRNGVPNNEGPLLVLRTRDGKVVTAGVYLGSKQERHPPTCYTTTTHLLLFPDTSWQFLHTLATAGWPQPGTDEHPELRNLHPELYKLVHTNAPLV